MKGRFYSIQNRTQRDNPSKFLVLSREGEETPMKKIGLALGGGGARGLCHIEFCRALDDMGLQPSIISGTSIGSIIGGFYASGMSGAAMKALAGEIGLLDYGKMIDLSLRSHSGIVKGKRVAEFFEKHLPVKTFEELKIPLKVVATDFWKRQQVVFQSGKLIPAIRASISIPALFEPVKIDGIVMIDGGAINPLPYDIIRNECDLLIAIDVSGTTMPSKNHPLPTIFESIMNTFHIIESALIENKMKLLQPDVYIKPALENIQILDFHRQKEIMDSVKDDVAMFKEELEKRIKQEEIPKFKKEKRFLFFRR